MAETVAHLAANEGGHLSPLVFLYTWPDEDRFFKTLAPLLGPEQPVYALATPSDAVLQTFDSVDQWVDYDHAQLAQLPVEPPYHFAAWSFGGVVALELARRLAHEGTPVAFLGLIDSWLPKRKPRGYLAKLGHDVGQLEVLPEAERRAYALALARGMPPRALDLLTQERRKLVRRWRRVPPKPRLVLPPAKRAIWVPYLKYQPQPYFAPVTLYVCDESVVHNDGDPSLRWARWLVAGFEVVPIPGDHRSLWTPPNVEVLARALRRDGDLAVVSPVASP